MQHSIGHISASPGRFGTAIAAAGALALTVLLFAFAASAKAEITDPIAATAEEVAETAAPPVPPEPDPTVNLPEAPVTDDVAQQVRAVVDSAVPSTAQATDSARATQEDVAETIAPVAHSAEATAKAASVDRIRALAHNQLRAASETLRDVSGGLLAKAASESPLATAGPSGAGAGSPSQPTAPGHQDEAPASMHPPRQGSLLQGIPTGYLGESEGFELLRAELPRVALGPENVLPRGSADGTRAFSGDAGVHFESLMSPGGDSHQPHLPHQPLLPLPGSSLAGASGWGGSSFVPIAALLALLALVVPAIIRRLREAPDLRAPTLFVCALERPG